MTSTMVLTGDVRARLRQLPADSIHCVVTSPPYWGLRDYGVDGQIGLEATLPEHLALMVDVFREVRRVLRKDGTCWVNYGDAYVSAPGKGGGWRGDNKGSAPGGNVPQKRNEPHGFFKPKDRMLLPARLAIALCDDGWWLRDEIVWHKPNPMPISVTDRTTPAHEMLYMFSKSARYDYDQEAIKEPIAESSKARYAQESLNTQTGGYKQEQYEAGLTGQRSRSRRPAEILKTLAGSTVRNRRSVWTIATKPLKEAHFATFPPALIEPCILAGCPVGGVVLDPFFGSGTTGLVAAKHGRNCIGIELNSEYVEISARRLGLQRISADIHGCTHA